MFRFSLSALEKNDKLVWVATRPKYVLVLTVNKEIALHIMTLHVWKTSFYERYINWSENEKMNWMLSK